VPDPTKAFLSAISSRVQVFVHNKLPVKEPSIALSEALQREVFSACRERMFSFFYTRKVNRKNFVVTRRTYTWLSAILNFAPLGALTFKTAESAPE
jgi:hypothetical protein